LRIGNGYEGTPLSELGWNLALFYPSNLTLYLLNTTTPHQNGMVWNAASWDPVQSLMLVTGSLDSNNNWYSFDLFFTGYFPYNNTWVLFNVTTKDHPISKLNNMATTWYNGKLYMWGGIDENWVDHNDVSYRRSN
jgi:hypothetical protein